jgi:uncharacterized membrane protein YeaQ/YmgE (transglycosylase-associated protein family)
MALETFVIILLVGIAGGAIAHLFVRHGGFGLAGDMLVAVAGALITGFMLPTVGLSLGGGIPGALITAAVGTVAVLWTLRKLKTA